jgi:hypothetical protein
MRWVERGNKSRRELGVVGKEKYEGNIPNSVAVIEPSLSRSNKEKASLKSAICSGEICGGCC